MYKEMAELNVDQLIRSTRERRGCNVEHRHNWLPCRHCYFARSLLSFSCTHSTLFPRALKFWFKFSSAREERISAGQALAVKRRALSTRAAVAGIAVGNRSAVYAHYREC